MSLMSSSIILSANKSSFKNVVLLVALKYQKKLFFPTRSRIAFFYRATMSNTLRIAAIDEYKKALSQKGTSTCVYLVAIQLPTNLYPFFRCHS